MDKITPRANLHCVGKSGKFYHLLAGKTVEVDLPDLANLDPRDYVVGEKPAEAEQPKNKKK